MTNCFCCASNVFKQPDYYNNLLTAVKFTLKLPKELKITQLNLLLVAIPEDTHKSEPINQKNKLKTLL